MPDPFIWYWRRWPCERWGEPGVRKGQRCRVVLQASGPGPRNALVEFEDGARYVVTSAARRYALRRAATAPA